MNRSFLLTLLLFRFLIYLSGFYAEKRWFFFLQSVTQAYAQNNSTFSARSLAWYPLVTSPYVLLLSYKEPLWVRTVKRHIMNKRLGVNFPLGAFPHAPNKQSRVNVTTVAQPLPHPPYDVGTRIPAIFPLVSALCWVEEGKQQRNLKTDSSAFSNIVTEIIHCIA